MEILLSGPDWKFKDFVPYRATGHKVYRPDFDWSGWPNATVPGNAQLDLLRNGLIEDIYLDCHSRDAEWVSQRQWVYAKKFVLGEELAGKRITLRFDGIDYSGSIYLNSEYLGDFKNLFIPVEFDISDRANVGGENSIMVLIDPAPNEYAQYGWTSKVRTFKPRMNYGWDFAARCIPLGIWQDVKLLVTGPARITDCWAHSTLSDDFSTGKIELITRLDSKTSEKLLIESQIRQGEEVVASGSIELNAQAGEHVVQQTYNMDRPALWWPNGYGDQPLYEASVVVRNAATGEVTDEHAVTFGFKRVRLTPNPGIPEGLRPWCFEVNGVRTFIKGWNWVPVDELYGGKYVDKVERLVRLAAKANVNLLRIWGGGIIEKRHFYELCDRFGIMVWQEFPLTSSGLDDTPSTDPEFLSELKAMAAAVVPTRRNYACHTVWCGGNELTWTGEEDLAMQTMHEVCAELDPDKPFVPTSPLWTGLPGEAAEIDIHGMWWHQGVSEHYTMYNQRTPAFHSEFGAEGAANFENVERFIKDTKLWPVSLKNPIYMHRGQDWLREGIIKTLFGEIDNALHYFALSQFVQWEGLRYIVESGRRRKYACGGVIPWQYNEPWPNLFCTNCVDYYTDPKMAYYAVANAYAPVLVSARYDSLRCEPGQAFHARCFINNTGRELRACRLEWKIYTLGGEQMAEGSSAVDLQPNSAGEYEPIEWAVPQDFRQIFVLFLNLSDAAENVLSTNAYIFSSAPDPIFAGLIEPPEAHIKVLGSNSSPAGDGSNLSIEIANNGSGCALFVRARPVDNRQSAYFKNNYLVLGPGDRAVIEAYLAKSISQFVISGWNTNSEMVP